MTHQDPYYWPQPEHLPRHAAPARLLPPPYERALRLLVAAGIAAAGLCLVIGAVALVAAAGAPSRGATVTPTAHQSAALRSDQAGAAGRSRTRAAAGSRTRAAAGGRTGAGGPSPARPALLLGLAGDGSEITRRFRVGRPGTWNLSWSFHGCRGQRRRTEFLVTDGSPTGNGSATGNGSTTKNGSATRNGSATGNGSGAGIGLAASGPAGHGVSRAYADPGWQHLIIRSGCAWTIRVTGPR